VVFCLTYYYAESFGIVSLDVGEDDVETIKEDFKLFGELHNG